MKILVLGVTGMLGNSVFNFFCQNENHDVWGTLRHSDALKYFPTVVHSKLLRNVDILNTDNLIPVLADLRPNVVINCIGLIKQHTMSKDPLTALPLNSLFPHRLAQLCDFSGSKLIHISTDCVFSGKKGFYSESDISDAEDLYGKSKYIGEVIDVPHAITLRTSMIGHELNGGHSLVDWFLSQNNETKGFTKAIFSGLPTIEIANIICKHILPHLELSGLYHVAAEPINKFDLISLLAKIYRKKIAIIPDSNLVIDRSLNANRFNQATGYVPPKWPLLIQKMYEANQKRIK